MAAPSQQHLRVLELYSGIGGMHWALKESHIEYEVVMAVDINTTANKIYQHNFPDVNLHSFGIEKLTLKKLQSLKIDAILMSPPCQPFTRVGKKGDCDDVRTKSFLHLLQLIKQMERKPTYILVENVKGFETSQTRGLLLECLENCGYTHQEFLLTPLQFSIPNCRLRYYLVAKCLGKFSFSESSDIMLQIPETGHPCSDAKEKLKDLTSTRLANSDSIPNESSSQAYTDHSESEGTGDCIVNESQTQYPSSECNDSYCSSSPPITSKTDTVELRLKQVTQIRGETREENVMAELREAGRNMRYCEEEEKFVNELSRPLSDFMELQPQEELNQYLLSDKELRFFVVMDIVYPALKKSICFTKRYGHYVEGAGSVVQMSTDVQATRAASEFKSLAVELQNSQMWEEKELSLLRKLRLRYFTPREVANLLCFPSDFEFPEGLSMIQKYRVLGNSLNVHVVAKLIKLMIS